MSRRLLGKVTGKIGGLILRLPLWLAAVLATGTYFLLDWYIKQGSGDSTSQGIWGSEGGSGSFDQLASLGRFLVPAAILLVAVYSLYRRRKRANLLVDAARGAEADLKRLSGSHFKYLVGEYFRERGFELEGHLTRNGGRVPFIVAKGRERYLVQSVHDKPAEMNTSLIYELRNAADRQGATGAMIVTSGSIPEEIKQTAKAGKIGLLDGHELYNRIRAQAQTAENYSRSTADGKMIFRILARAGVVMAFALAGLVYTEQGRQIQDIAVKQIGRYVDLTRLQHWFDSARRTVVGEEERELIFTEEQVEEAMREVLLEKQTRTADTAEEAKELPRYRYEIELHSGGWIFTDNIDIGAGSITYTNKKGLEISLMRDEVKTLKRVQVN